MGACYLAMAFVCHASTALMLVPSICRHTPPRVRLRRLWFAVRLNASLSGFTHLLLYFLMPPEFVRPSETLHIFGASLLLLVLSAD